MILRGTLDLKFFADDTMLFSILYDPLISAIDLNLNIICQWAHQWKMEFNPDPTKQANEISFLVRNLVQTILN